MCGSATFAMLVSRTSMKAASATATAIAHGLARGRQPRPGRAEAGSGAVALPVFASKAGTTPCEAERYGALAEPREPRGSFDQLIPAAQARVRRQAPRLYRAGAQAAPHDPIV